MSSGQIQVKQADQVVHNFDNQYARTGGKRMSSVEKIHLIEICHCNIMK